MKPVVTVEEMRAIDAESHVPTDELIRRAGSAVARSVLRRLGGSYGRTVVVVAGKGHNGDDGRVAGANLRRRGVRVHIVDAASPTEPLPPCDLVIDAAFGTGFKGRYSPPTPPEGVRVLAVDIPSGLNGDTGEVEGGAVRADCTVSFAAWKPGLLLGEGPERSGQVEVADIGLDPSRAAIRLVEDHDVRSALPHRRRSGHKWDAAVYVVAGSHGMMGSARLCSTAAMRAGSGMVRLGVPGADPLDLPATETVATVLPFRAWEASVLAELGRCKALVVGPGLGRGDSVTQSVRRVVTEAPLPVVVDADGINAVGTAAEVRSIVDRRRHPLIVTPHDGEFATMSGSQPGPDRVGAARDLARSSGANVLLKGSTTVVARPDGSAFVVSAGSPRLATAGTGDVLSGVIGAFLARGLPAPEAAAFAAHAHGRSAMLGKPEGLLAGDLLELIPSWLSEPPKDGGGG